MNRIKLVVSLFFIILISYINLLGQSENPINLSSSDGADSLSNILRMDIIKAFNLDSQYDTALKKKIFLKSAEAKLLSDSLKNLRSETLLRPYEVVLQVKADDYDLKKNGILICLHSQYLAGLSQSQEAIDEAYQEYRASSHVLENICFPSLPVTVSKTWMGANAAKFLFLVCNESVGSMMEQKELTLRLVFRLTGDVKKSKEFMAFYPSDIFYPIARNISLTFEDNGNIIFQSKYK
jgi:hypothetical protein